jgi:hypothetical protein
MSKIAVFFDAENVPSGAIPDIIAWLSGQGDILYQRAYADWSVKNTKAWQEQITRTPISVIQQFHNGQEQVIDKAIMMDAVALAIEHPEIDTFAIVASDNGYYMLSLRLRELGKNVIGLGEKQKCKPIWINSCNQFQYLEDLNPVTEELPDTKLNSRASLLKFLDMAYDSTPDSEGMGAKMLANLGNSIHRFKPDFSFKAFGYSSLLSMVEDFPEAYKVGVKTGTTPPIYYLSRKEQKPDKR